jgi:hypothetical protein
MCMATTKRRKTQPDSGPQKLLKLFVNSIIIIVVVLFVGIQITIQKNLLWSLWLLFIWQLRFDFHQYVEIASKNCCFILSDFVAHTHWRMSSHTPNFLSKIPWIIFRKLDSHFSFICYHFIKMEQSIFLEILYHFTKIPSWSQFAPPPFFFYLLLLFDLFVQMYCLFIFCH